MSKKDDVQLFIRSFLSPDNGSVEFHDLNTQFLIENGYSFNGEYLYFNNKNISPTMYNIIDIANKLFDCNIEFCEVGSYESCVYDMTCYAWSVIINGELYFDSIMEERY